LHNQQRCLEQIRKAGSGVIVFLFEGSAPDEDTAFAPDRW
jgi:hypothetical protein